MADRWYSEWKQAFVQGSSSGWVLTRGAALWLALALTIFLGTCIGAYFQSRELAAMTAKARNSVEIFAQVNALSAGFDRADTALQSYAVTGNRRYLDAYEAEAGVVQAQVERLRELTRDSPAQRERVEALSRQVETRFDAKNRAAGNDPPGEIAGFKEALLVIEGAERQTASRLDAAIARNGRAALILFPSAGALGLAFLAMAFWRLRHETRVIRNGEFYRAPREALEAMSDGFFAFDAQWRAIRANAAGLKLIGKTRQQALGKELWELFPASACSVNGREYQRAVRERIPVRFEEFIPAPLNQWFEVHAYVSNGDLNVFFYNITQRKRIEERLRQLSQAVEQSPSVVMIANTKGCIEYVNPKFTELTGYTFEETLGKNPRILNAGDSPSQGKELWSTILAGKEWRGEFHNKKKNGELYWEYASISPIFDEDGRITHFVAVKENITRRKMMEASLLQAKKEAEEASRTKDVFLATLSHELRTPLTPVLFAASAAENDETIDAEVREQFRMIRNNIELESRLIDDLLDITKITRGKFSLAFQPLSADETLGKTLQILRPEYTGKELSVEWKREAPASTVRADMARLHQVFWNLLKNAIKFTPAGGRIVIRTSNPDAGILAVEFRDSGVGIAPEHISQVFQPFQQGAATGNAHFGGLGLGLAITKAIVEVHGGHIEVASPGAGQGAVFTVFLPLWKGEEAPAAEAERSGANRPVPRRILIVEDDKSTRSVLTRILRKDGHHVEAVGSCAEALRLVRSQPEPLPFEAILCDIGLPDGSGLEIVSAVKEHSPGIYAVAVSGYGTADDLLRSREAGFDAHLVKPVSIEEVRLTLARA